MDHRLPTVRAALALLGLGEDADRDTVIRAYHRLARASHPDLSDAPDAAERFDAITAAYQRALDDVAARAPRLAVHRAATPPSPVDLSVHRAAVDRSQPMLIVGPVRVEPLRQEPLAPSDLLREGRHGGPWT